MEASTAKIVQELGLNVFITVGMFSLCVYIVRHLIRALDSLNDRIATSAQESSEAHRFQREEHAKLVQQLDRLLDRTPR